MKNISNTSRADLSQQIRSVQSVIFSCAFWVSTIISSPSWADEVIDIIDGKTTGKHLPLDHVDTEKAAQIAGILILWTVSESKAGWVHIEIPTEEICKNLYFCFFYFSLILAKKK